jgi:hypothetical protein
MTDIAGREGSPGQGACTVQAAAQLLGAALLAAVARLGRLLYVLGLLLLVCFVGCQLVPGRAHVPFGTARVQQQQSRVWVLLNLYWMRRWHDG